MSTLGMKIDTFEVFLGLLREKNSGFFYSKKIKELI